MDPSADIELVHRVSSGDTDAEVEFTERLRCVPKFVSRRSRRGGRQVQPADRDDVVQDTYVAVLRRLREFRGDSKLETWVCGFARVELQRRRRREACAPRLEAVDLHGLEGARDGTPDDGEALGLLLARLSGAAGAIARARHVEGVSFAEIARRSGESQAAVRSTYYRGLARVRMRVCED